MRIERFACMAVALLAVAPACGSGERPSGAVSAEPAAPATTSKTTTASGADPTSGWTSTPATRTPPAGAPDPDPAPAWDPEPEFDGIWPDNLLALDELRVAVEQGHQPWRSDPVETARAYVLQRGMADPVMGPYVATGPLTGDVGFDAGAHGVVVLGRIEGNPIPYVVSLRSSRVEILHLEREGGELRVEVHNRAPGTITAHVGRFASEWHDEKTVRVETGPLSLTLRALDGELPLLLEVRHEGVDGVLAVAAVRVRPEAAPPASPDRLSASSRLRIDGIGPIRVGMTVDQAKAAAGVPLTVMTSDYCTSLRGTGGPDGVTLVSPNESGGRITVIIVSTPVVSTLSGIRVGSTDADVLATYPGQIETVGTGDVHRLIFTAWDPTFRDRTLTFHIRNSRVAEMWAGVRGVERSDELCA
jgi:hypothetical protein